MVVEHQTQLSKMTSSEISVKKCNLEQWRLTTMLYSNHRHKRNEYLLIAPLNTYSFEARQVRETMRRAKRVKTFKFIHTYKVGLDRR